MSKPIEKFPTFGIAIPVRGQADLLPTALASLAVQTVDLKIAVMDATADDSVQQVLRAHDNLPVTYSRHGPDTGQAAAIKEGWNATNGDVLSWLNADDFLFPNTLELVGDVFASDPSVDVVYGDAVFVRRDGTFTGYFPSISDCPADLRFTCCISQPACFVRRAAVEHVGGVNVDLHYIMDWDLWTRLYLAGAKFFYLKRPLAVVRMYAETKTSSGGGRRMREIRNHLHNHAPLLKRLKSMVAFDLDYAAAKHDVLRRILHLAVGSYGAGKRALRGLVGRQIDKQLHGIEVITNRVYSKAEICLPWYGSAPTHELKIVYRPDVSVLAMLGGASLTLESLRVDGQGRSNATFSVPAEHSVSKLFEITLLSESPEPWDLESFSVS